MGFLCLLMSDSIVSLRNLKENQITRQKANATKLNTKIFKSFLTILEQFSDVCDVFKEKKNSSVRDDMSR